MIGLAIAAALLACAHGAVVPELDGRIVGGVLAKISEAPYQVALLGNGTGVYRLGCGGSIISRTVVLTAAHCTDRARANQLKIRAGSTQHDAGGQLIAVERIVQHPGFNFELDNDVSLLHLAEPLVLGVNVAIIPLPAQGETVPDGASAVITGWGHLKSGGSSPVDLYRAVLPVVNQQQCEAAHEFFNPVTERMLCAGVGGKDACQNDSGGPLAVNGVLMGVTSWGRGCAQPGYPGVWARVAAFRNWIDANM